VHLAKDHSLFDEGKALAAILKENPKSISSPGEKYVYSNIGYWLLGKIVEAVTKQDYQSYIQNNMFEPLHLKSEEIGFVIHAPDNHAKGYLLKYSILNLLKGFVTNKEVWGEYEGSWLHIQDVYVNGPAFGGVIGSAKAFSRILQDLLSENSMMLSKSTKELLYSRQKNSSGKNIDVTLGWHIGELNGIWYFFKEGGGAGFHCEMRVYPAVGLASVIMTNRTSFNSKKQLSSIDNHFIGR
jgi:CubicO group peptidase (beta-lactamase class C family)